MKLARFRVKGFRSLRDTDWIPIGELAVLIGENDGGKTATIDALRTFFGDRKLDSDDFYRSQGDQNVIREVILEAEFSIDEAQLSAVREMVPLCRLHETKLRLRRTYLLQGEDAADESFGIVADALTDSRLQADVALLRMDDLKSFVQEKELTVSGPQNKKETFIEAISSELARLDLEETVVRLSKPAAIGLQGFTLFREQNPRAIVAETVRAVFSEQLQKEAFRGTLDDIESAVRNEVRARTNTLVTFVKKYCPEIQSVEVDPEFDFMSGFRGASITVRDVGAEVLLERRGGGFQRKMILATYEWTSEILANGSAHLLAFDEPDLHLDYASQRRLFDIIKGFVDGGTQVIIATHSLNFVNRVQLSSLVHYSLDPSGCTKIEYLAEDSEEEELFLYQVSSGMGLDNSMMFYERAFVVVEGVTEMNALPGLYLKHKGHSLLADGIRTLNGEGNGGVRLFAKFLNSKKSNVVLLLDADAKEQAGGAGRIFTAESLKQDGFDEGKVFFVEPKEFEEAFSDEVWARAANGEFRKDGDEWTASDFSVLRGKAKSFKLGIQETLRTGDLARVGRALADSVQASSEIPAAITACLDEAQAIANPS